MFPLGSTSSLLSDVKYPEYSGLTLTIFGYVFGRRGRRFGLSGINTSHREITDVLFEKLNKLRALARVLQFLCDPSLVGLVQGGAPEEGISG